MSEVKAIEGGYDQFIEGGEPAGNFNPDVTVWSTWGVRSALHRMHKKFSGLESDFKEATKELEALRAENAELKRKLSQAQGVAMDSDEIDALASATGGNEQ
jgi:hypothetical protein